MLYSAELSPACKPLPMYGVSLVAVCSPNRIGPIDSQLAPVTRWSCYWQCAAEVESLPPSIAPPPMPINLASTVKLVGPSLHLCLWLATAIAIGWGSARVSANGQMGTDCKFEANRLLSLIPIQLYPQQRKTNTVSPTYGANGSHIAQLYIHAGVQIQISGTHCPVWYSSPYLRSNYWTRGS